MALFAPYYQFQWHVWKFEGHIHPFISDLSCVHVKLQFKKKYVFMFVCLFRISAWRPMSRSSCQPSRATYSSTSIIRSTWYVTTATRQPTEMLPHCQKPQMKLDPILFLCNTSHCLPVLSVETREEERGGAVEETVGGPGAREDSEQITLLQRGQALSLTPLRLPLQPLFF